MKKLFLSLFVLFVLTHAAVILVATNNSAGGKKTAAKNPKCANLVVGSPDLHPAVKTKERSTWVKIEDVYVAGADFNR